MTSRRLAMAALAATVISTLGASAARADFALLSQNVSVDRAEQQAHFTLNFNQAPNFHSADAFGRQADSFQIEFDGAYQGTSDFQTFTNDTAVIRGEEIHLANDLRVRSPVGDGGAGSGGWGPVLTTVPFMLTGSTVSFSVPTADLGWTGGDFRYIASSYVFGSQTATTDVRVVPLPPAVAMGGLGLLGVAIATAVSKRRAISRGN